MRIIGATLSIASAACFALACTVPPERTALATEPASPAADRSAAASAIGPEDDR